MTNKIIEEAHIQGDTGNRCNSCKEVGSHRISEMVFSIKQKEMHSGFDLKMKWLFFILLTMLEFMGRNFLYATHW